MPVYRVHWDGTNEFGGRIASGVYLYIVKVRDEDTGKTAIVTKKLAIIH